MWHAICTPTLRASTLALPAVLRRSAGKLPPFSPQKDETYREPELQSYYVAVAGIGQLPLPIRLLLPLLLLLSSLLLSSLNLSHATHL